MRSINPKADLIEHDRVSGHYGVDVTVTIDGRPAFASKMKYEQRDGIFPADEAHVPCRPNKFAGNGLYVQVRRDGKALRIAPVSVIGT
jgi:hypothetical protein